MKNLGTSEAEAEILAEMSRLAKVEEDDDVVDDVPQDEHYLGVGPKDNSGALVSALQGTDVSGTAGILAWYLLHRSMEGPQNLTITQILMVYPLHSQELSSLSLHLSALVCLGPLSPS